MKFVHITDTHLVTPGEFLHTLDPLSRFQACIESVNENHSDAEFAVISGDLADKGELSAYRSLREELTTLSIPYFLLIGNHDSRAVFLSVFDDTQVDENGFVQGVHSTVHGEFVFLDTVQEGQSAGVYCDSRCQWLERTLSSMQKTPVYLFMHHPPFDVHVPFVDNIGLESKREFTAVISRYANIKHIFFGHVHRPISGSWHDIPFSTLSGTNHQVALNLQGVDRIPYSNEPPAYNVILLDADTTVVHTFPFLNCKQLDL